MEGPPPPWEKESCDVAESKAGWVRVREDFREELLPVWLLMMLLLLLLLLLLLFFICDTNDDSCSNASKSPSNRLLTVLRAV